MGPERGGGLPVDALGNPGSTASCLGPQRPDLHPARRPVRRGLRPHAPQPGRLGQCEALQRACRRGGSWTSPTVRSADETLYVPGPYKMPGQAIGSDSPPTAKGVFNNNQTYTGCAIDKAGDVFGNDIATAQGQYPSPSSGRLVQWFTPNYTTAMHRLGSGPGGVRTTSHRWIRRPGPARDDGPGRQRRPAGSQHRHFERVPLRRIVDANAVPRNAREAYTHAARCTLTDFVQDRLLSGRCRQGPNV